MSEARRKIHRVLGLPVKYIWFSLRFDGNGVDSIVELDLINWLSKELWAGLANLELFGRAILNNIERY